MTHFMPVSVKIALAIFLFSALTLQAAEPMYFGADAGYESKYVWRGMPFNPESVLWPDAWVSFHGITATVWGSMEMTDVYEKANKFTEVDYYFDYTCAFGTINTSLGYAIYNYPNTDFLATSEMYAAVASDFPFASGSLTAYFDVGEAEGIYLQPSLSHSFGLSPIDPTVTASLGYATGKHNLYYFGVDKSAFVDLTTSLKLVFTPTGPLGNYMSLYGHLSWAKILDNELADMWEDDSNFWFGIGVNFFHQTGGGE